MRFIEIVGVKLGNMKKAQDWTVTPTEEIADGIIMMQCDKRPARVNLHTGKAMLGNGKGGTYSNGFAFLKPSMGGTEVDVPADVIEQIKAKLEGRDDYKSGSIRVL